MIQASPRTHTPDFLFFEVEPVEELMDENFEHGVDCSQKSTFDLENQVQITFELLFVDFEGELHN